MTMEAISGMVVTAALTLAASVIAQAIFWAVTLRHRRQTIVAALRAELKVLRGTISSDVEGYRASLRKGDPPTPTVFAYPTSVFDSAVGNLGQVRDDDLVEHIVETYTMIKSLSEDANAYRNIGNADISLSELNEVYLSAVSTQVSILKLHNRLKGQPYSDVDDDSESETLRDLAKHGDELQTEGIHRLLDRKWSE